jgi:uncharacterized membrane protein YbhN (UPF0104 family)
MITWRRSWRFAQTILAIALVGFAGWYLWRQWRDASAANLHLRVQPGWLALSSLLVLATYAFLIEVWRQVLARFGSGVAFSEAARIWFVSNLGKYVPGKVWQVTTMAAMLSRRGVGLPAAGGAAAVITLANVAAGFALLLVIGVPALSALGAGMRTGVRTGTLVLVLAMLMVPFMTRPLARIFERVFRRPITLRMPLAALGISFGGCAIAWLLYGLAFELFTVSILGPPRGPWLAYVAAYTVSYLIGYLILIVPGGIGPRETVLTAVLVALHMATPAEAAAVAIASRLWLTVLEVLPGLLYIAMPQRRQRAVDASADARP